MSPNRNEILFNEAALNALKRHQLQSLTKRYGLRSNRKNSDMVQRLQEFAQTMSPGRPIYSPGPSATPGPNDFMSDGHDMSDVTPTQPLHTRYMHIGRQAKTSTGSEAWEMLSDSGASMLSPVNSKGKGKGEEKSDSMRSWKSAGNGQKLDDFGGGVEDMVSSGSMTSIKSLASSLKRSASQHLMSRSRRSSINMLAPASGSAPESALEVDAVEEIESLPPSPASTVGVPRRYSGMSLLERPSTVRLVASPPPPEPESGDEADDLPFVGTKSVQLLKERRSMAPLRSMDGAMAGTSLSRKSMPAISATTSASVSNIYPPLPPIPAQFQKSRPLPTLAMPGALPVSLPRQQQSGPFIFGSPQNAVSNREFSEAGRAILAQMNAKMPEGFAFSEEHLKGRQAGVSKLVKTTSTLGEGGWGLSGSLGPKVDRYADAHQREFSKMRSISKQNLGTLGSSTSASTTSLSTSITRAKAKASVATLNAGSTPGKRKRSSVHLPSAPNGAALAPQPETEVRAPDAKKKRLSYLGSLADAGRSMLSLGESEKGAGKSGKKVTPKRRPSILPGGFKSKFGWLSRKKRRSTTPAQEPVRVPIMPRKTSVYAPREMPPAKPVFDLNASLTRSTTTSKREPTDYMSPTIAQKQRQASSSAQTVLSVSTARSRSRIPDFGPSGSIAAAGSSVNTLGLPRPTGSTSSTMRKQSQAEILKKVRPAPAPPVPSDSARVKPTTTVTSSRLYAPTASSLARMQATVKPPSRPLPNVPRTASASTSAQTVTSSMPTTEPFGNASSRDNVLFQSNFNVAKPTKTTQTPGLRKGKSTVQLKSPMKSAPSSRLRSQVSGIHAVKSRPDMKKEREVQARKAEIKARQERVGEERELRRMLGDEE